MPSWPCLLLPESRCQNELDCSLSLYQNLTGASGCASIVLLQKPSYIREIIFFCLSFPLFTIYADNIDICFLLFRVAALDTYSSLTYFRDLEPFPKPQARLCMTLLSRELATVNSPFSLSAPRVILSQYHTQIFTHRSQSLSRSPWILLVRMQKLSLVLHIFLHNLSKHCLFGKHSKLSYVGSHLAKPTLFRPNILLLCLCQIQNWHDGAYVWTFFESRDAACDEIIFLRLKDSKMFDMFAPHLTETHGVCFDGSVPNSHYKVPAQQFKSSTTVLFYHV